MTEGVTDRLPSGLDVAIAVEAAGLSHLVLRAGDRDAERARTAAARLGTMSKPSGESVKTTSEASMVADPAGVRQSIVPPHQVTVDGIPPLSVA